MNASNIYYLNYLPSILELRYAERMLEYQYLIMINIENEVVLSNSKTKLITLNKEGGTVC